MDLDLKGKVAVITGSSRGIGFSIAERLAEEGSAVVISARGADDLRESAIKIASKGLDVHSIQVDLMDPSAPGHLIEETVRKYGRLDILINNVGGNRRKPFEATSDDDWRDLLELNFQSHVRCSRAVIPHMKKQSGGAILFISSIYGREAGGPELSIYNATKSALISLAKIMSLELAGDNIRVNSVAPGSVRFPGGSWDRRVLADPEGMAKFVKENLPLGRFGTADEIADVVAFLVSSRASLITGACLNVDGGQSRSLI